MTVLAPSDTADRSTFDAIFETLDRSSRDTIGRATGRLLVIPIHDAAGNVVGGLWAISLFQWLHLEMLAVPEGMRGQGVGKALIASAEAEALNRGCIGIYVDTFSFQAAPFYAKMGFSVFGVLDDCPPGHRRLFMQKRLVPIGQG